MKSLPNEYVLLKKINTFIQEYFASLPNPQVARSTDIYDFVKRKTDVQKQILSAAQFNHFLRKMHEEGVLTQFIKNVKVDTSNKNFYQWYFYPPQREMIRETTDKDKNIASSHPETNTFFKGNKKHKAANGVMVRSMQELNIINRLLAIDVFDVYYERKLIAAKQERYPDFTIYNKKTNTVFHWEHFGMSNNTMYDEKMTEKIEWYNQIGYKSIDEGGRLIISVYKDDLQFIGMVDEIIEKIQHISIPTGFFRYYRSE